jgi:anaerobic ribonucleoside-triphosphate reductase activating protein
MELNLAACVKYSTANGPGKRSVVWVQGCPFRCKGCFNPGFQPFQRRVIISPGTLAEEVSANDGIEGVTFTGGEPFCQAAALAKTGRYLQNLGLNVVTFTGFSYETVRLKKRHSWESLLKVTDLLVAGPYESEYACRHPLISSSNQELVDLSGVFAGRIEETGNVPAIEYIIRPGGEIILTGFPEPDLFSGTFERRNKHVTFLKD